MSKNTFVVFNVETGKVLDINLEWVEAEQFNLAKLFYFDEVPTDAPEFHKCRYVQVELIPVAILNVYEDQFEALDSELSEAIMVAYNRGATEWVEKNYPEFFKKLVDTQ